MTDRELIELVQSKSPEELTLAEIQLLRARIEDSAELQQALADEICLDQYLADALGGIDLSVDEIIAKAPVRHRGSATLLATFGWGPCLLLLLFLGLIFSRVWIEPPKARQALAPAASESDAIKDASVKPTVAPAAATSASDTPQDSTPHVSEQRRIVEADSDAGIEKRPAVAREPLSTKEFKTKPDTQKPEHSKPKSTDSESKSPPAQPKAAEKPPAKPWDAPSQLGGGARPFADVAFRDDAALAPQLKAADLKTWLHSTGGRRNGLFDSRTGAKARGLTKLKAPWPKDGMLRLSLKDHRFLKIHCWHGRQGVSLVHYDARPHLAWAAYRTSRDRDNQHSPASWALTATDYGRNWRTGVVHFSRFQTVDLHYRDGEMVLSTGDLVLLKAPLDGPPDVVYFDGPMDLRDIRMLHSQMPGDEHQPPRPLLIDTADCDKLPWQTQLAGGSVLDKQNDGSVELVGKSPESMARANFKLPTSGIYDVVVQLDSDSPGTGIYLGDAEGEPLLGARLLRSRRDGAMMAGLRAFDSDQLTVDLDADRVPAPYVGRRTWLRLLAAAGSLRLWTSVDGVHWGQSGTPVAYGVNRPIETLGIYALRGSEARRITLRRVRVRQYPRFTAMADADLVTKAPIVLAGGVHAWRSEVDERRPEGTGVDAWRNACAIRTIAGGGEPRLAGALLSLLLAQGLDRSQPVDARLALLDEFTELGVLWSPPSESLHWLDVAKLYEAIGVELAHHGDAQPFTKVGKRCVRLPIWTNFQYHMLLARLAQRELIAQVAQRRWPEVRALCEELTSYNYHPLDSLITWARARADREDPAGRDGEITPLVPRWRHPLNIELSKEGYNVLAELEVALAGEAYDDACQIITNVTASDTFGLLPEAKDPDRWLSFPLAVSSAMRRHPDLAATMRNEYGPLGALRVREAIAAADHERLAAATVQFHGTPAAASAHLWLGDRALSIGSFAEALTHFRLAEQSAEAAQRAELAAHRRLAAAMLGREVKAASSGPVQIGDAQLTAQQFESIVAAALENHRATPSGGEKIGADSTPPDIAPAPTGFVAARQARVTDGRKETDVPKAAQERKVDWTARQVGSTRRGDRLYVNSGYQVTCYDLVGGEQRWQTRVAEPGLDRHDWSLVPMRPAVAGERLIAQRYTRGREYQGRTKYSGSTLICLDRESGKMQWQGLPDTSDQVLSNPVIVGEEVVAVTARTATREMAISLSFFDIESGNPVRSQPIALLGESWHEYRACSLSVGPDALYGVTGGAVFCSSQRGEIRWMRRQTWLSPMQNTNWAEQHSEPVLLSDGRLYVTQPGVPAVECLDADQGSVRWRRVLTDVRRIAGLVEGRVIVEVDNGLLALDAEDGSVAWHHASRELLDALLTGGPGGILYTRRVPADEKASKFQPQLVWLDAKTGRARASCLLPALADKEVLLADFITHDKSLWAMFGSRYRETNRQLVRLTPEGDADGVPDDLAEVDPWSRYDAAE